MSPSYDDIRGAYKFVERGLTNRFSGGKVTTGTTVEASGDTTLLTPESGKQLTLYWIALMAAEANTAEVLATVKIGEEAIYECYLGKSVPFAHWEPVEGAANAKLVLNLSGAQKVAVSFTYTQSNPGG
jgi:hypothetical protein